MRFSCGAAVSFILAVAVVTSAQVADDQYVRVYSMIEAADKLRAQGDARSAVTRYLEAQVELRQLQQSFPEWNPKLMSFRLDYVSSQLAALTQKHPTAVNEAAQAAQPTP